MKEKQRVCKLDSSHDDKIWYIIDGEWLKDWKMFVNNKRSRAAFGARMSVNERIGILDPGTINNYKLLDFEGNPLPNLRKGQDYRAVNGEVWKVLHSTYGGGPVIR